MTDFVYTDDSNIVSFNRWARFGFLRPIFYFHGFLDWKAYCVMSDVKACQNEPLVDLNDNKSYFLFYPKIDSSHRQSTTDPDNSRLPVIIIT